MMSDLAVSGRAGDMTFVSDVGLESSQHGLRIFTVVRERFSKVAKSSAQCCNDRALV
jgi:hypothetical protein